MVKQTFTKTMLSTLDKEEEFSFHPYIQTPAGVSLLILYEESDQWIRLSH